MSGLTDTLTRRLVLLGLVTALISVVAVGLVAIPLVRTEAQSRASAQLAEQADLVAGLARGLTDGRGERPQEVLSQLAASGVRADVVLLGDPPPPDIPGSLVQEGFRLGTASGVEGDPPRLIEVRQIDFGALLVLSTAATAAVNDVAAPLLSRLAVSLLVGLVLAVATATLVARRLARPLRDTAEAARRLSTGSGPCGWCPKGRSRSPTWLRRSTAWPTRSSARRAGSGASSSPSATSSARRSPPSVATPRPSPTASSPVPTPARQAR